ncbi:MAG: DUF177 domain-containing protein [Candidatus Omnitrophota bacterium]|jgi:uncharacterized protein
MKIDVRQIPETGLMLTEEFSSKDLDLDTDLIRFLSPIKAKAVISKSYGAVRVSLTLSSLININCGRCLKEEKKDFNREIEFNYAVDKSDSILDLDPDIREEIILDYPIKPLCHIDCKGLCPKCGVNLNEGGCNCGTT